MLLTLLQILYQKKSHLHIYMCTSIMKTIVSQLLHLNTITTYKVSH